MHPDDAKDIIGATCSVLEDKTRIWHVKMPAFFQADLRLPDIISPVLHWLGDAEADLNDYLKDPTNPVLCLPTQDDSQYWRLKLTYEECAHGEPGSTLNFWQLSMNSQRLTLGVKMHSTAAFLSMPNQHGLAMGGTAERGFNDNSARGYPARLTLTTRQVTDVVMYDEDILAIKGGRQIAAPEPHLDDETRSERTHQLCFELPQWIP